MKNLQKIKNILLSDNAWEAVLADKELFGPTIAEMDGVPHVNYHAEGGVLDHVKLAFEEMQKIPDHDWFDLLLVLFHDVGKRKALAENGGKNMAKHEVHSANWFCEWCEQFDVFGEDRILPIVGDWVIRSHMDAHHLNERSSVYGVMLVVTHGWFPRLARLATADALATLDEDGNPRWPFSDVLSSPNVQRWLGKPKPLPIVSEDDYRDRGVPEKVLPEVVEFGLKIQLNSKHTDPARIINDVLTCGKIKQLIKDEETRLAMAEVRRWQE